MQGYLSSNDCNLEEFSKSLDRHVKSKRCATSSRHQKKYSYL